MTKNVNTVPWPPFKRSGTTITPRTTNDNVDLLGGQLHFNDDISLNLGNTLAAPDARLLWETKDANANVLLLSLPEGGGGTNQPGFVVGDTTALDKDLGLFDGATFNNPFIAVLDGAATKALYSYHDGTDAFIKSTSGDLYLVPASAALDVFVGDGTMNARLNVLGGSGGSTMFAWREGTTTRAQLTANYSFDQLALFVNANAGNQLVIATDNATAQDYDHAAETDPALYIQSSIAPDTDNTEYIKLQYNTSTSKGTLGVGKGYFQISPTTNGEGLCFANAEVETTDATETTAMTLATSSNRAYHVTTYVVGLKQDNSAAASYALHGTFNNNGGVLSVIGTTSQVHVAESDAAWDASYDVSTTNIRVRVTGKAATNIRWHITSQYTSITY